MVQKSVQRALPSNTMNLNLLTMQPRVFATRPHEVWKRGGEILAVGNFKFYDKIGRTHQRRNFWQSRMGRNSEIGRIDGRFHYFDLPPSLLIQIRFWWFLYCSKAENESFPTVPFSPKTDVYWQTKIHNLTFRVSTQPSEIFRNRHVGRGRRSPEMPFIPTLL